MVQIEHPRLQVIQQASSMLVTRVIIAGKLGLKLLLLAYRYLFDNLAVFEFERLECHRIEP